MDKNHAWLTRKLEAGVNSPASFCVRLAWRVAHKRHLVESNSASYPIAADFDPTRHWPAWLTGQTRGQEDFLLASFVLE
jgi:hypothetical protein